MPLQTWKSPVDLTASPALAALLQRQGPVDACAEAHAEAVHQRQTAKATRRATAAKPSPRGAAAPRSPQRQASIERRRRMVGTIALPPHLACQFTWGEQAYLRAIANEVKRHGICDLHVDALAAMAGVRRTTGQNAQRRARQLGLITVEQRRPPGRRKNLTNIIRIVSPEWQTWIRRGPRAWAQEVSQSGSNKKTSTTDTKDKQEAPNAGFGATWQRYFQHYDPGCRPQKEKQAFFAAEISAKTHAFS